MICNKTISLRIFTWVIFPGLLLLSLIAASASADDKIGLDLEWRPITGVKKAPPPARGEKVETFTVNGVSFKMARIPAGEFMMGSPSGELGRDSDEKRHRVRISKSFFLGETEVTQGLWRTVMGSNPSSFKNCGNNCPVEQVSWKDCQEFIRKLNRLVSGGGFRLPTEAEWEYAARAGSNSAFANGGISETGCGHDRKLDAMGWYCGNSGKKTHPVGGKKPNAWGLYDMHGNVYEWCQDWKGNYPSGSVTDPTGPSSGSDRVLRGGSWDYYAGYCRSALRNGDGPDYRGRRFGFRLARF